MQPLAILRDWCQWLGANEQRSVLIMGIPDDCEEQEFQDTLHAALKTLGRYRVLGKVYRREIGAKIALVEFAEALTRALIPQQIRGKGGPWRVVAPPPTPDSESPEGSSFPDEAREEGAEGWAGAAAHVPGEAATSHEEGAAAEAGAVEAGEVAGAREMAEEGGAGEAGAGDDELSDGEGAAGDGGAVGGAGSPSMGGEMGPGEEMGTVGEAGATGGSRPMQEEAWTQQWRQALQPVLESSTYQELRTFSGLQDVEHCNEAFESWLHHANDMMFLWRHVAERERRRRLLESLGGPALDVVFDLLARNPHVCAQDCLVALVQVFGSQDPQVTARLRFVTCAQRPQETLFAYVMRLEGLLQAALEKGAINPAVANQLRARQVLMQARPNDTLHQKLRRLRLERRPPGLVGLLQLIRETAACEARPESEEGAAGLLAGEAVSGALISEGAQGAAPGSSHGADAAPGAGPAGEEESTPARAVLQVPPLGRVATATGLSSEPESMAWAGGHKTKEGDASKESGSQAGQENPPQGPTKK